MAALVVGLTGLYATGKSTLSTIFEKYNYYLIEVDKLGHQALIDKQDQIIDLFGKNILDQRDHIDRKKLGDLVFQDSELLKKLERIVHPCMVHKVRELTQKYQNKKILINAALLIEMKLHLLCDKVILLNAPEDKLIQWAMKRDHLDENEVKLRLKNQHSVKMKQKYADYLIVNNGKLEELYEQATRLINTMEEEIL